VNKNRKSIELGVLSYWKKRSSGEEGITINERVAVLLLTETADGDAVEEPCHVASGWRVM
jgi:hypothetical protein